jgi:hypothetical protein
MDAGSSVSHPSGRRHVEQGSVSHLAHRSQPSARSPASRMTGVPILRIISSRSDGLPLAFLLLPLRGDFSSSLGPSGPVALGSDSLIPVISPSVPASVRPSSPSTKTAASCSTVSASAGPSTAGPAATRDAEVGGKRILRDDGTRTRTERKVRKDAHTRWALQAATYAFRARDVRGGQPPRCAASGPGARTGRARRRERTARKSELLVVSSQLRSLTISWPKRIRPTRTVE